MYSFRNFGCDVSKIDSIIKVHQNSELEKAVRALDITKVRKALEDGAYVDTRNDCDRTALMIVSGKRGENVIPIIDVLVGAVASISARSYELYTPLLYAAKEGDVATVGHLIKIGCNYRAVDRDGFGLLEVASEKGPFEICANSAVCDFLRSFIAAKYDVSKIDNIVV